MIQKTWKWYGVGLVLLVALERVPVAGVTEGWTMEVKQLNKQVEQLYSQGRYADAIPLAQRALAIRDKTAEEDSDTADSLNNLALLYHSTGTYDEAEPLYQWALAIRMRVFGPDALEVAESLGNLGELYRAMGNYTEAKVRLQRAVEIIEKDLGSEHPELVEALNSLAIIQQGTGAYTEAETLLERALRICNTSMGDPLRSALTLNNLAFLYQDTGAYPRAEQYFQRALELHNNLLGPEHPDTVTSLNNLAALYEVLGFHNKAEPLLRRALAARENALGPKHPATARSVNNLAALYQDAGDYGKAEPLYLQALAIQETTLGPDHPDYSATQNNLATVYHATGAYEKAEALYNRALVIQEKLYGAERPEIVSVLSNYAVLRWAAYGASAALSLANRAQRIDEEGIISFLLYGSEARKQAYLQQLRGRLFINISLSLAVPDRRGTILGLDAVLHAKGRVLDAMSDSAARLRRSVNPDDRVLFDQLASIAQQVSAVTFQGLGQLPLDVYSKRLADLTAQQDQLETELSKRSAEFRREMTPTTFAEVQAALPDETALIEWFRYRPFDPKAQERKRPRLGNARYVAYVLRHNGEPAVVDVGEAEAIERLIQDFRTALSDPQSAYVKEAASELSNQLIKPLRPHLGNAQQWLISPDGTLNLVPFAALVDENGAYLATQVDVTYLTSGRDVLRFEAFSDPGPSAVVVADPDYGQDIGPTAKANLRIIPSRSSDLDRGGMVFDPLPGTAEEAKALNTLFQNMEQEVLTQANATEDRLKRLHGPSILHVATHGFFLKDNETAGADYGRSEFPDKQRFMPLSENPFLRSGLALAGANLRHSGETDDGILTAAEVAQMDLQGTQLVVLSACETGVGEVQNGEGVYGLRRALVLAGAQTQVASLWKVADEATKDLMVDYYQRLLNGEGRSVALREAQRTMIISKERSHPYYWAAFVPIGHWTPLTQSR
jgi:CHAT domain-containing protein/Tfp pilus assembly protein PilF